LAIIDLSPTGNQPLGNEDGSIQIIFNGEIYNHPELRDDLKKRGHTFRGTSDTEVMVHLYEEEGPALIDRLRGMFAFAIYDRSRRSLLLGRDRFGIKPLYYTLLPTQVVFASEIKALLAARGVPRRLDRQACYDFLSLAYVPEPATAFQDVRMMPRGATLVFDEAGVHPRSMPAPRAVPRLDYRSENAVADAREALLAAARRQARADVPIAAFLSGGIDSSLVVAALCRVLPEPPKTFNVRFPDLEFDETAVAIAVARHCGTDHRTVDVNPASLEAGAVANLLRHFDQPYADTSLLPTYAVCRAVRDHGIICALSGDGGDEAFGGYASFWRLQPLRWLIALPEPLRTSVELAGSALSGVTSDFGRRLVRVMRLASASRMDTATLLASLYSYLNEGQKTELLRADARGGLAPVSHCFGPHEPPGARDLETLSRRVTEAYFGNNLPGDMLRKVDMMSMRNSLEVRVPMLDEDLVSVGLQLPHALKATTRRGKLVLRALAAQWLPSEVANHPKHGFSIPLDRMVGPAFHDMLTDHLGQSGSRVRTFTEPPVVDRWLRWFRDAGRGAPTGEVSRIGLAQRIVMLLSLELWLREQSLSW
jgi:asparagine synthase (glutamine-hydrolysing)